MTRKTDLRSLDTVGAPDLWPAIQSGRPRPVDFGPPARSTIQRVTAGVVALVITVGGGLLLMRAFVDSDERSAPSISLPGGDIATSGELIAFSTSQMHIAVIRPDGSNERVLTTGDEVATSVAGDVADQSPQWSPDGSSIYFVRIVGDSSWLCEIKADGRGFQVIDREFNGAHLALSPDGSQIAYDSKDGSLHLSALDGSNDQVLAAHVAGPWGGWGPNRPAWSPDGSQVAFAAPMKGAGTCAERCALWVMDVASGRRVNLTEDEPQGKVVSVTWSATGRIGYAALDGSVEGLPRIRLWTTEADGSDQQEIPSTGDIVPVAWSPDGSLLLVGRYRDAPTMKDEGLFIAAEGSLGLLIADARSAFGDWRP
jgi:Tol biopolymer transport system component